MALKVWLPLIKDLSNQGLSDVTITNSGATLNSAGKLGGCYSFVPGSSNKITNAFSTNVTSPIGSLACWVKFNSFPSSSGWYCLMHVGRSGGFAACRFGMYMEYTNTINISINGSGATKNTYTHSLVTNQWYHLCTTYNGTTLKFYIDGVEVMSNTPAVGTYTTDATSLFVGGTNNYYLNGYLNDVRYYDHALSDKEVKILSQGLVAHYQLNGYGSQENLFSWQNKGNQVITLNTYQNVGSFLQFNNCLTFDPSTTVGTKYTISLWARSPNGPTRLSIYNSNGTPRWFYFSTTLSSSLGSEWEYFTYTFTNSDRGSGNETDSIVRRIEIYMPSQTGGQVKDIKIEVGETATRWSPGPTDSMYSRLGYDSTTVYDSSGFNNHGVIYSYDNLGSVEPIISGGRNSIATFINSENTTTSTASGTKFVYGYCGLTTPQYLTIAFWCNPTCGYGSTSATGQGQFCTTSNAIGISAGTDYNTTAMHHRDSCIDMCTSTNVNKRMSVTFIKDEWHHYAFVYDGRYGIVYRDGVRQNGLDMETVATLKSFTAVVIGYSHAGGAIRSNQSRYSDFRVYTTALSSDDVKAVYEAPVSVSDHGGMFTQGEFVEV